MLGKPESEISDEERARAKPVNFGSLYGLGPSGFVATAWEESRRWRGGAADR
jgi:DNA polymerase I-like protein with 3'-5' exonuclease and polymerase domains